MRQTERAIEDAVTRQHTHTQGKAHGPGLLVTIDVHMDGDGQSRRSARRRRGANGGSSGWLTLVLVVVLVVVVSDDAN